MVYRDFWTVYPPGQFYILAWLFRVFGTSMMVERVFYVAVQILLAVCAYLLARTLAGRWSGFFAALLTCAWLGAVPLYGYRLHISLFLSLTSCLFVIKYIDCRRRLWLVVAGVTVALAALDRHDFGFYTFVAQSVVLVLFAYRRAAGAGFVRARRVLAALGTFGGFAGAVAVVLLPILAILLMKVGAKELVQDLIIFPALVLGEFRALPYPSLWPSSMVLSGGDQSLWQFFQIVLSRSVFYVPVVFVPVAVQALVTACRRERFLARQWGIVLMLLLGAGFFNYARSRTDLAHMTPINIVAVIVLASGLLAGWKKSGAGPHFVLRRVVTVTLTLMTVLSFGHRSIHRANLVLDLFQSSELVGMELARARGLRLMRGRAEVIQNAVGYIQQRVPPDEKIFVCNFRHDNIFINNVIFYFLAERHCASKYHELHPGLATTLPVQSQIIEDLRRHNVRYIVLMALPALVSTEPNKSSQSSGVKALDNFIVSHYTQAKRFGPYVVLRNRALVDGSQDFR